MRYKLLFLSLILLVILSLLTACKNGDDFIDSLSFSDKADNEATYAFTTKDSIQEFEFTVQSEDENASDIYEPEDEDLTSNVWITESGAKYHSKSSCSNMKSPKEIQISEAIKLGYEPCKRCYKE